MVPVVIMIDPCSGHKGHIPHSAGDPDLVAGIVLYRY